jgi:hypothetical protein
MKYYFLLLFTLTTASSALSQGYGAVPSNVRAANTIRHLDFITSKDIMVGIPMPPKTLVGDPYLDSAWQNASILLYNTEKLLEGYPVRYDLIQQEMEVRSKSGIKVIEGKKIKSFVWIDLLSKTPKYFINARDYKTTDGGQIEGFFCVVSDGKLPLFRLTESYIKKATYSVQFDVGAKDDKVVKKEKLYYALDGKVIQVPASRKKLLPAFEARKNEVDAFIKSNSLSLLEDDHVKRIFDFYNTLN